LFCPRASAEELMEMEGEDKHVDGQCRRLAQLSSSTMMTDCFRSHNNSCGVPSSVAMMNKSLLDGQKNTVCQSTDLPDARDVGQIFSGANNMVINSTQMTTIMGGTQIPNTKKKLAQDSEDSSYDSDCEVSDGTHYDVSRTVSDTLAQEFSEYVTLNSSSSGNSATNFESTVQDQVFIFFRCNRLSAFLIL